MDFIEGKIVGNIAETIVEFMFKDLGFMVFRTGQEKIADPLLQLKNFIPKCGGKFNLNQDIENLSVARTLSKLPDFVVVSPQGRIEFIEVKFRSEGRMSERDLEVFEEFPDCSIIVVNSRINDTITYGIKTSFNEEVDEETKKLMQETRFHVTMLDGWEETEKDEDNSEDDEAEECEEYCKVITRCYATSLKEWLKVKFDIENDAIVHKYEKLVVKWISETLQKEKDGLKEIEEKRQKEYEDD